MERVPIFRRTAWVIPLGLAAVAAPYAILYLRETPTSLPGSLLALVPFLGALGTASAFALSVHVLIEVRGIRDTLPVLLRTTLVSLLLFAHLIYTSDDALLLTYQLILFDLDLMILALGLSLFLASQFVLPVETFQDRIRAFRRLAGYALGERGPVTFVEEGITRQAYGEDRRPGPGVFLIDHASAVVLRTDTAFTRAMGPGIVFSKPGERCAEALDLRPQIRRLSAKRETTGDSDTEITSEAITQDGIEISAEITIEFILDPGLEGSPRLGRLADKPPYQYHPTSAERAVYGHTFGDLGDMPWTQLPGLLVADLWREEIKQWPLDRLLDMTLSSTSPLEQIRGALHAKLVPTLPRDFKNRDHPQTQASRELEILTSRGIRILDIQFGDLQLPDLIQEERVLRWREAWAGEVQRALQDAQEDLKRVQEESERSADIDFLKDFGSSIVEAARSNKHPAMRDSLLALLADTQRSTSTYEKLDPQLRARLSEIESELQDLDTDCRDQRD